MLRSRKNPVFPGPIVHFEDDIDLYGDYARSGKTCLEGTLQNQVALDHHLRSSCQPVGRAAISLAAYQNFFSAGDWAAARASRTWARQDPDTQINAGHQDRAMLNSMFPSIDERACTRDNPSRALSFPPEEWLQEFGAPQERPVQRPNSARPLPASCVCKNPFRKFEQPLEREESMDWTCGLFGTPECRYPQVSQAPEKFSRERIPVNSNNPYPHGQMQPPHALAKVKHRSCDERARYSSCTFDSMRNSLCDMDEVVEEPSLRTGFEDDAVRPYWRRGNSLRL